MKLLIFAMALVTSFSSIASDCVVSLPKEIPSEIGAALTSVGIKTREDACKENSNFIVKSYAGLVNKSYCLEYVEGIVSNEDLVALDVLDGFLSVITVGVFTELRHAPFENFKVEVLPGVKLLQTTHTGINYVNFNYEKQTIGLINSDFSFTRKFRNRKNIKNENRSDSIARLVSNIENQLSCYNGEIILK